MAALIATWSKDPSKKIGAVAVRNNRLLAQGYNGFPKGIPDKVEWLHNRDKKLELMVHAEMNMVYNAAHNDVNLVDSTVYIHGLPSCHECAKGLIQAGVSKIVMYDAFEDPCWVESWEKSKSMYDYAKIKYYLS